MKKFYSILFLVAFIAIITSGLKRSNAYFRETKNLGEVNYLTPKPLEGEETVAKADTTKKAEPATEGQKAGEGEK